MCKKIIQIFLNIFTTLVSLLAALYSPVCWLRIILAVSALTGLYLSIDAISRGSKLAGKIRQNELSISGHEERIDTLEKEQSHVDDEETLHLAR